MIVRRAACPRLPERHKAFAALIPVGQQRRERDIIDLVGRFNHSGDWTMVVPAESLEVVIVRK